MWGRLATCAAVGYRRRSTAKASGAGWNPAAGWQPNATRFLVVGTIALIGLHQLFGGAEVLRLANLQPCAQTSRGAEGLRLRSGSLQEATNWSMRCTLAWYSAGVEAAAKPGRAAFTTSCEREKLSRRGSRLYSSAAAFITARTRL